MARKPKDTTPPPAPTPFLQEIYTELDKIGLEKVQQDVINMPKNTLAYKIAKKYVEYRINNQK